LKIPVCQGAVTAGDDEEVIDGLPKHRHSQFVGLSDKASSSGTCLER